LCIQKTLIHNEFCYHFSKYTRPLCPSRRFADEHERPVLQHDEVAQQQRRAGGDEEGPGEHGCGREERNFSGS